MNEREALVRAIQSPDCKTPIEYCLLAFGVTVSDIRGKTLLDIGSGSSLFSSQLAHLADHQDFFAVALDPRYREPHNARFSEGPDEHRVAGLAQGSLPFRNASFDFVFSMSAVPKFLQDDEIVPFVEDVLRVLKPGGTGAFYPLLTASGHSFTIPSLDGQLLIEPVSAFLVDHLLDPRYRKYQSMRQRLTVRKKPA